MFFFREIVTHISRVLIDTFKWPKNNFFLFCLKYRCTHVFVRCLFRLRRATQFRWRARPWNVSMSYLSASFCLCVPMPLKLPIFCCRLTSKKMKVDCRKVFLSCVYWLCQPTWSSNGYIWALGGGWKFEKGKQTQREGAKYIQYLKIAFAFRLIMSFKRTNKQAETPLQQRRREQKGCTLTRDPWWYARSPSGWNNKGQVHHLCETRSGKLCKSESFGWLPLERPLFAREWRNIGTAHSVTPKREQQQKKKQCRNKVKGRKRLLATTQT